MIPPQRRDMWRTVMKHVLPETQVELIKKTILLHKLQTRNKPLMVIYKSLDKIFIICISINIPRDSITLANVLAK